MSSKRFLPDLTAAVEKAAAQNPALTADFSCAVDQVLPVFDSLGMVMAFAKTEMLAKNESIRGLIPKYATLKDIVDADKKSNTVTTKNSGARNLHRLRTVILFISQLLQNLIADADATLSAAATEAYKETLAVYHSTIVRGSVSTGMMLLPSRAAFLESLGESDASGGDAAAYVSAATKLCAAIDSLYDSPMPATTAWF